MSLFISSLNSGSNGNCYYIGNEEEAVLIDGGISCRETEKRMKRLGLSMKKVKAVFVSHEHGDHIHGVPVLARKHKLIVYITKPTQGRMLLEGRIESFKPYEPVQIGNLTITAFPKLHDASDPHSFLVSSQTVTVGIFTDIGTPCDHVVRNFQQCHAAFLEANYDEDMLNNGRYPYHLKERIRGDRGHLSNKQAMDLFLQHRPSFMTHLFLSHLSQDNNRVALVQKLFTPIAGGTKIIVASRHRETPVYHIRNAMNRVVKIMRPKSFVSPDQLSLFA
ncbi:MAG TPA: MBL fold metallo-hydrolase [Ohtaekwangia sp.]